MTNDAHETSASDDPSKELDKDPIRYLPRPESNKGKRTPAERIGLIAFLVLASSLVATFAFFFVTQGIAGGGFIKPKSTMSNTEPAPIETSIPEPSETSVVENTTKPTLPPRATDSSSDVPTEEKYAKIDAYLESIEWNSTGEADSINYYTSENAPDFLFFHGSIEEEDSPEELQEHFDRIKAKVLENPNIECRQSTSFFLDCDPFSNDNIAVTLSFMEKSGEVKLNLTDIGDRARERTGP